MCYNATIERAPRGRRFFCGRSRVSFLAEGGCVPMGVFPAEVGAVNAMKGDHYEHGTVPAAVLLVTGVA